MTLLTKEKTIKNYKKNSYGEVQKEILKLLDYQKGTSVRSIMRKTAFTDQSIQRALRLLRKQNKVFSVSARSLGSELHSQILLWYLS